MANINIRNFPATRQQLIAAAQPNDPNQLERIPHCLYDTQQVAAAVPTQVTFFQSIQVDRTLSNMPGQGQLPDPQWFALHTINVDILSVPSYTAAATPAGAINDIEQLLKTGRGILTLTISDKPYGPWPLTFANASGGTTGQSHGTFTAPASFNLANNGIPGTDGIPYQNGAVLIPPKVAFGVTLNFAAGVTIAVATNIRVNLVGVLYRRVV